MPIISCPHCGARRDMPPDRVPKQVTRARCPECLQTFRFVPDTPPLANTADAQRDQLTAIGTLLTESWELFCRRGWKLCAIYLLATLVLVTPLVAAAIILPNLVKGNPALIWGCLAVALVYALFGSAWMTAALLHSVIFPQLNIRGAFAKGWQDSGAYCKLILLIGFVVTGGSLLLLIPGLIFMTWFLFSQYILAEERLGGLAALERSRRLVQGHGWEVFGRFALMLLITLAISTLTGLLPIVGHFARHAVLLLLTLFSLFYYYLIYQDLKRCADNTPGRPIPSRRKAYLAVAGFGWLLIPALFIVTHRQALSNLTAIHHSSPGFINQATGAPATLAELTEDLSPQISYPAPQQLTASDYDRLLRERRLPADRAGVDLGPAVLSAKRFWIDKRNPYLSLEVKLADLPNLALSARRSTRVLIEQVMDTEQHNQYNPQHSFESAPFQWIDIRSDKSDQGYSGIRYVYLKRGAQPERISSISGRLELTLPLGIETLQFSRQDVGKEFSVAGKRLKLEALDTDRLSFSFRGKLAQILSIRAFNRRAQPLREEGETWQKDGQQVNLQQMFNGRIDAVTVLVATDTMTRSYPFEITR